MKPEREQNNRGTYRTNWWIFGEPRADLRPALAGLPRYIATVETAKHRAFTFLPAEVAPDNKLIVIASDNDYVLGVLQSRQHVAWALAQEVRLEDRPVYAKGECFDPFPFPAATPLQREHIGMLVEELDAHRKTRLAARPELTLTALYNTLEAVRAGRTLTEAEKAVHDSGQVSILRELHDRLDRAVAEAYGWPPDLPAAEIVARVVALNAERVREEAEGKVRWLRPEFQAPTEARRRAVQAELGVEQAAAGAERAWPKDAPSQFIVLRSALADTPGLPRDLARRFGGARRGRRLTEMLETLVALGQARSEGDGRYRA